MEAASIQWRPIGELFVSRGMISQEQLEDALAEQASSGRRLGEILVERQLISSTELTETLMEQLGQQVVKQEGFGSGLWSQIQRRHAREVEPRITLVEDSEPSEFGSKPHEFSVAADAGPTGTELSPAELDEEFEKLESDLGLEAKTVELASPGNPDAPSSDEVHALEAKVASLTIELDQAKASVDEREQLLAEEVEVRQQAAREVEQLRERLTEKEAEIASVRAEQPAAPATGEPAWAERDDVRHQLDMRIARVSQLEHELGQRAEQLAALEQRIDQANRVFANVQDDERKVAELEAEIATLRVQLELADATLEDERKARAEARRLADELGQTHAELIDELVMAKATAEATEASLAREREDHRDTRTRLDEAAANLAEMAAKLEDVEDRQAAPTESVMPDRQPGEYLCFVPGKDGYRLEEATGAMPVIGDRHGLDGVEYVVTRVARSPLPFDPRRCAYLQRS